MIRFIAIIAFVLEVATCGVSPLPAFSQEACRTDCATRCVNGFCQWRCDWICPPAPPPVCGRFCAWQRDGYGNVVWECRTECRP